MTYPFPQGTLSIVDAVNRLAHRRDDEWTIWSVLQQVALREICDAARTGNLRAYVLDSAGESHEADRAQFAALGDREPTMLSLQEFPSTTSRMTNLNPMCLRLLPVDREYRVYGKLFFFLTDLKDVFGDDAPAESSFDERAANQVRASVTDDEITGFLQSLGCTNGDAAWPLVRDKFGIKQAHFRSLWKRGPFGGRPGRPVNSVGNSVKN